MATEGCVTIDFFGRDCKLKKQFLAKNKTFTHLQYIERSCFSNCVKNMCHMEALAGCELELVAGSLGLCSPLPVWYIWGGFQEEIFQTVKQFRTCRVTGAPSVHFWFQNEQDGTIWDVLDVLYFLETAAPLVKKTVDTSGFVHGCLIPGKTSKELESCGLKYVPASPLIQEILVRKHTAKISHQELETI